MPEVHKCVLKGGMAGKPKRNDTTRYTASQMLLFSLHSPVFMAELVQGRGEATLVWKSWLAHVACLKLMLVSEYTEERLLQLDRAIKKYQEAFLQANSVLMPNAYMQ